MAPTFSPFFWIITILHGNSELNECNIVTDVWEINSQLGCCALDEQLYYSPFAHRNGNKQFCDIDIIDSTISPTEFNTKYWNKKPVLINSNLSEWCMNHTFWETNNLLQLFPNFRFQTGKSVQLVRYNKGETEITLQQYIDIKNDPNEEPMYIFDRELWGLNLPLFVDNIKLPQYIELNTSSTSIYGIFLFGNENTGASFHVHDTAVAGLIQGTKRWFLYPPSFSPIGGFWSGYAAIDWYNLYSNVLQNTNINNVNVMTVNNYSKVIKKIQKYDKRVDIDNDKRLKKEINNLFSADIQTLNDVFENVNTLSQYYYYKPLECIQNKGQLLYVPKGWLHSVINLDDVVGISVQKQQQMTADPQRQMPTGATAQFLRGNQFLESDDWTKGEEFYLKAILMDPTFVEAYLGLARLYLSSLEDYAIAERLLRIGYILNNKHEEVIFLLKEILKQQNKHHLLHYLDENAPLPS